MKNTTEVNKTSPAGHTRHWPINNEWLVAIASFILLVTGLILDYWIRPLWFEGMLRIVWYAVAYVPVGLPVLVRGIRLAVRGDVFTEFFLMSIATLGAFYIGEYPEGVAVMLFYAIGELFQGAAVNRAKRSIQALLDVRPSHALVLRNGRYLTVDPASVEVNETIQVKAGERVPLDGRILNEGSAFNTAALTGESRPVAIEKGGTVLAGMINEAAVAELKVTKPFHESTLARILALVRHATGRKAKTELFIRKFARVYTPIVVFLAIALTFIPCFFVADYSFHQWLYRALIFLVISCPCALVVAIPLGYFGGIGAGSRNGILFKGSSYLDRITRLDTVVMDKTGTLTKGIFTVRKIVGVGMDEKTWLPLVAALESQSNHPIARAIVAYAGLADGLRVDNVTEDRGYGIKGNVAGRTVLAGSARMFRKNNIPLEFDLPSATEAILFVAVDGRPVGYIVVADALKDDAKETVSGLHANNIRTVMLSGDKQDIVTKAAMDLGIQEAYGELLPEDKVVKFEAIKKGKQGAVAFVGDGINDAPVLAISDIGIAMGGLGSDAAIETADVVIQTDHPAKILTAIKIGKATNSIVWQNIGLAFGVKIIVLAAGAWGFASMWGAVFADVGVALLAILNAVRIQQMKF
ncbi:MAG TPA: heavy metal translocating P-type ATPase [Ohtaekwangia sp.]|nr:heavy metal translocating P-type ATPase [Ohtaekwangia sp.]